ncbi:MAG TPA: 5'-3' exonuclease H3TH domain-containing protein [Spirochaetia bacterium]|nr:5'-3' exonuclease H3TH domain-containing protein [Spirochaetia bacterium]
MIVHLVDGTYELFRCYYGNKRSGRADDRRGAVRLVLQTLISMAEDGGTHFGIATDHVIESFRNALWSGYKTGEGVEPQLLAQFHPLEEALSVFGFRVWPMVELEADDALASAAGLADAAEEVEKVCIWSPDKDLAQCVKGTRVVQVDRRGGHIRDAAAVAQKFGVPPASIPDYLALVGDSADGYPGIPGWGARSAAAALSRYSHLSDMPIHDPAWRPPVANAARLAESLRSSWDRALLFLRLATLRTDAPVFSSVDELRWKGPGPDALRLAGSVGDDALFERAGKAFAGSA